MVDALTYRERFALTLAQRSVDRPPLDLASTDMEPAKLKAAFGDRLTFYGGVDTQYLLPQGPAERVAAETRELIRVLGHNGGYILSAAHCIQEDVPLENVLAMYRAAKESAT